MKQSYCAIFTPACQGAPANILTVRRKCQKLLVKQTLSDCVSGKNDPQRTEQRLDRKQKPPNRAIQQQLRHAQTAGRLGDILLANA